MLTIRSSDIDLYPGSQEERLPGFSAQFPHICSHVLLPDGPAGACTWHWHKSMELFYVEKGALVYHTPGGQRLFRAGSGGMVNSNVLHRTQSLKNGTALRLHLFEAELLAGVPGGTVQQRYITPLVQRPGLELLALSPEVPGQAAALDLLRQSLYTRYDSLCRYGLCAAAAAACPCRTGTQHCQRQGEADDPVHDGSCCRKALGGRHRSRGVLQRTGMLPLLWHLPAHHPLGLPAEHPAADGKPAAPPDKACRHRHRPALRPWQQQLLWGAIPTAFRLFAHRLPGKMAGY